MDDREVERLLRAARPMSGNRDLPLSDRAKRELAELLMSEAPVGSTGRTGSLAPVRAASAVAAPRWTPGQPRRGHRWSLLALAGGLAVLTGVVLNWPGAPSSAATATPPPLVVHELAVPGPQVLDDLAARAAAVPDQPVDEGATETITIDSWVLTMEENGGRVDPAATVVQPEVWTIALRPDGSVLTTVRAGEPYDSAGTPASSDVAPGTLLWTREEGRLERQLVFDEPAPTDAAALGAFLSRGLGRDVSGSADEAFHAIHLLLNEQRLDAAQAAALVTFIGTLPDFKVAGLSTDRLDRPAVVIEAQGSADDFVNAILLDPETGAVLAIETTYTGSDRTDVATGAVVEYHTWEND